MQFASLNPSENRLTVNKKFTNLNSQIPAKKEIEHGMSPKQISEIVSDHLIEVVRKQFAETKKQLETCQ